MHGHRGTRRWRPENTLAAFEYAAAAGADAIEMDVVVTRDDVPVISHDPKLKPRAVIRKMSLAQLRRLDPSVPTLDEVLRRFEDTALTFNIEIKSFPDFRKWTPPAEAYARLVLERIRKHHVESRVMIQSFDFRILLAMKCLAPGIRRSALWAWRGRDLVRMAQQAGGTQMVSPQHRLVTAKHVEAAHRAGIQVLTWTANRRTTWKRLVAAGVDGIITDNPAGLIAYLQRRGLR